MEAPQYIYSFFSSDFVTHWLMVKDTIPYE